MKALLQEQLEVSLPDGFTVPGAGMDDVDTALQLFNRWSQSVLHEDEITDAVAIRTEWVSPGFDPAEDIRLVFAPDGEMVGYVEVWTTVKPPVHPWIWARVGWVAGKPWIHKIAGFHVNEMYSPWSPWETVAANFLEANKRTETLRVWVNTSLGETWEEQGVTVDDTALGGRREDYGSGDLLPEVILLLTAGVDVQDDRIEGTTWGFGLGEESWVIQHAVFRGNPETSLRVWRDLDDWLLTTWPHENGNSLRIASACVDSEGHASQQVYDFTRKREARRVWAIIGRAGAGLPLIKITPRRTLAKVVLGVVRSPSAWATAPPRSRITGDSSSCGAKRTRSSSR